MTEKLLLCEFHDAEIATLQFVFPKGLVITFSQLNCYYESEEPNVADIWINQATLSFSDIDHVSLSLPGHERLWVIHEEFVFKDPDIRDNTNRLLLGGQECRRAKIVFVSGDEICVDGGQVQLEIISHVRFLEKVDWSNEQA